MLQGLNFSYAYRDSVEYFSGLNALIVGGSFEAEADGSEKKSEIGLEIRPKFANVLVKVVNVDLLDVKSKFRFSEESKTIDAEINIHGSEPLIAHSQLKNYNTFRYSVAKKANPNRQLVVNAGFDSGEKFNYRVAVENDGKKESDLIRGNVNLDSGDFLKNEYEANMNEIKKQFVVPVKEAAMKTLSEQKKALKTSAGETLRANWETMKKIGDKFPSLTEASGSFLKEWPTIRNEFASDTNLRKIFDYL